MLGRCCGAAMAEATCVLASVLKDALRDRGDAQRGGVAGVPGSDDLVDALVDLGGIDVQAGECRAGKPLVGGERQQQVLGVQVAVAKAARMNSGGGQQGARVLVEVFRPSVRVHGGNEALLSGLFA